jgi:hypothetical protein
MIFTSWLAFRELRELFRCSRFLASTRAAAIFYRRFHGRNFAYQLGWICPTPPPQTWPDAASIARRKLNIDGGELRGRPNELCQLSQASIYLGYDGGHSSALLRKTHLHYGPEAEAARAAGADRDATRWCAGGWQAFLSVRRGLRCGDGTRASGSTFNPYRKHHSEAHPCDRYF